MTALSGATWRAAVVGRWVAHVVGTLIALLILAFLIGEGPPPIFRQDLSQNLVFLGVVLLVIGPLLSWIWDAPGGLVTVAGYALLLMLPLDKRAGNWLYTISGTAGLLLLLCWARLRTGPAAAGDWRIPKPVLLAAGTALGCFVLLCANEAFGMPPLMTPAFRPPADMPGMWQGSLNGQLDARFTIAPDGSVSGQVGGAGILGGRIIYNRSWFGRLMHWRTEVLIMGRLSEVVQSGGGIAGDRFTAPLNYFGPELKGALFLSHPGHAMPLGLRLRKQ